MRWAAFDHEFVDPFPEYYRYTESLNYMLKLKIIGGKVSMREKGNFRNNNGRIHA